MKKGVKRLFAALLAVALTFSVALGVGEGYADALGGLTQEGQLTLFGRVLAPVSQRFGELDFEKMSDEKKLDLFNVLSLTGYPGLTGETTRTQPEVAGLMRRYFGTEVDFSAFQTDSLPTLAQRTHGHLCYGGQVYFRTLRNLSTEVSPVTPLHLYALGDSRYAAVYTQKEQERWAVVEQEEDIWRILRLFAGGTTPTDYQLAQFDLPSPWASGELRRAQEERLTAALSPDVGVQTTATRLQFAQLAVSLAQRLSGQELPAAEGVFADCDDEFVRKAYQAGIVTGVADGVFDPEGVLTREQLATMLWRVMAYLQPEAEPSTPDLSAYQDGYQVSPWARQGVSALAKAGILKGTGGNHLSPQQPCTVEQAVLLVYRVFALLDK